MRTFPRVIKEFFAAHRFYTITAVIIIVLLIELANFWFVAKTMSGIRVFISTQEDWSLAQKDIYHYLLEYANTRDQLYYDKIEDSLRFYRGDRNAKLEMEKPNTDYKVVSREFTSAGMHPKDVNDTVFLFKTFRKINYVAEAIAIWDEGDVLAQKNIEIQKKLHFIISASYLNESVSQKVEEELKISALVAEAKDINNQLSSLAVRYTAVLGYASRTTKNLLTIVTVVLTIILGFFATFVTSVIQRMTTQVEKEKGDFMRIANHQLNTPISIMKNAHEMVKEKSLTLEKGFEYSDVGLARVVNVFEDIKTVLEFDGKAIYNIKPTNIELAMEEAAAYAKKTISTNKKDIKVFVEKPSFKVPRVLCDLKQLNNAIYNLLDNAVYYTPKGTITISYELFNKKYLKINIKDTGIGFGPEDKEKLGSKFYRTKKALLARPDGSGLGLYICKNIIGAHGGQLFFDSPGEGKGATFGFTLPTAN